jgi:hypothetical protein
MLTGANVARLRRSMSLYISLGGPEELRCKPLAEICLVLECNNPPLNDYTHQENEAHGVVVLKDAHSEFLEGSVTFARHSISEAYRETVAARTSHYTNIRNFKTWIKVFHRLSKRQIDLARLKVQEWLGNHPVALQKSRRGFVNIASQVPNFRDKQDLTGQRSELVMNAETSDDIGNPVEIEGEKPSAPLPQSQDADIVTDTSIAQTVSTTAVSSGNLTTSDLTWLKQPISSTTSYLAISPEARGDIIAEFYDVSVDLNIKIPRMRLKLEYASVKECMSNSSDFFWEFVCSTFCIAARNMAKTRTSRSGGYARACSIQEFEYR